MIVVQVVEKGRFLQKHVIEKYSTFLKFKFSKSFKKQWIVIFVTARLFGEILSSCWVDSNIKSLILQRNSGPPSTPNLHITSFSLTVLSFQMKKLLWPELTLTPATVSSTTTWPTPGELCPTLMLHKVEN